MPLFILDTGNLCSESLFPSHPSLLSVLLGVYKHINLLKENFLECFSHACDLRSQNSPECSGTPRWVPP